MFATAIVCSLFLDKEPKIGSMKLSTNGEYELMYVPKGEFIMGSNVDPTNTDEMPIRRVKLDAYWIGRNDVTVAQFREFCNATRNPYPWNARQPIYHGWRLDEPMINVTWQEARDYCRWAGGDLPTEAQWEKAARGTDGRNFPWGNAFDPSRLWCAGGRGAATNTVPVGSFPGGVSPYGCLDMAGQVFNWCLDWYAPYDAKETNNPVGPLLGSQGKVVRGGGWFPEMKGNFRCAYRGNYSPNNPDFCSFGIRVVMQK